ncbi:hypothetical protein B0H21DRAFT_524266 [Amylocystis lapponica]|nr:hypothetical protein B0H21DRAFT_524266 [Amylocystis lapponica]
MPAPITSSAPKPTKAIDKPFPHPHSRKTRIVRRRGRVHGGIESDDEIEREVRTDSDTDDDQSSLDSESDAESVSDGVRMNRRSEVVTPSTTQSPPPLDLDAHPPLDVDLASKPPAIVSAGPFVGATDWAEMVSAEHANGVEDLPVIDFADLDRARIDQHLARPTRPRRADKPAKRHVAQRSLSAPPTSPPPAPDDSAGAVAEEEPVASTSAHSAEEPHPPRLRGQSARQAYQQRLESDPSYVPTVGEFWGHDDRLLDKDLRSLSGWWRGRWQSRGRGRGAFNMRGRGGRGFFAGRPVPSNEDGDGGDAAPAPAEVPPIEQPWTHDGFEEMKRRDERRRPQQQQQEQPQPQVQFRGQRGFGFRGRSVFMGARGRGGFVRGGVLSPTGSRQGLPFGAIAGRPWFAMKPERMWTKQHDAFLYFDPALKPRPGQGPGFRIKFPGGVAQVIRGRPRSFHVTSEEQAVVSPSNLSQDDGDKQIVVRMPRRAGKEKAKEDSPAAPVEEATVEEAATTGAELSIEEVFTVRPHIAPNRRVDIPIPPNPPIRRQSYPVSTPVSAPTSALASTIPALRSQPDSPASTSHVLDSWSMHSPEHAPVAPSPPVDDAPLNAQIIETVLRHPSSSDLGIAQPVPSQEGQRPAPPLLHPLQTSFSPIPQTSPSYGSPYVYGSTLPPGIAMNQHGMPYEMATGRAVYLQPTPPPQMFTPRPMMHGHMSHPSGSIPFVPSHMHHHSTASPDFLAHPHTPPMNPFIDPSTGVPIFAPARQSSRIEIRAPTEQLENKKQPARPSGLRTTVSSSEQYPTVNGAPSAMFFPNASEPPMPAAVGGVVPVNGAIPSDQPPLQSLDPALAYPPYQQQYYYPDRYAYPGYMDMSPQPVQYEMYPADHHASQPMIYY